MNHLEASYKGKNEWWRYVVMIVAVFVASNTVGSLPLLISYAVKSISDPNTVANLAANPNNFARSGFSSNTLLVLMLCPFIAGLAAFFLLVRPLHKRSFTEVINGNRRIRWNRFFISMAVWYLLSAVYFLVYLKVDPENFSVANSGRIVVILALISFFLIPFQASLEEVLFRGYLMQGFAAILRNRWFPLLATSVLFGLLHGLNPEVKEYGFFTMMPQYIIFGLIFGIITIMDDGAEAAMGAHTANNTFLCITVTNKASALQTAALYEQTRIYPWTEFIALLVTGVLFILILKVIFRWKSFSVLAGRTDTPLVSEPVN
jgi:uncharacterized protein